MQILKTFINFLTSSAVFITAILAYLIVNKLWKRKHESAVAERISVFSQLIGMIISGTFAINFFLLGQWLGGLDRSLWAAESCLELLIGIGNKFDYYPSCKVGWQTKNRFWEETDDNPIYGGISWIDQRMTQIWYPSSGFHSRTGTLTAAYNRGRRAEEFGNLSLEERFKEALEGGEKLHPGVYKQSVMYETRLSVAWQKMPYFIGGWAQAIASADQGIEPSDPRYEEAKRKRKAYEDVSGKFYPYGQIYLAGDYLSYMPGWQEGCLTSAQMAVDRIIKRVSPSKSKLMRSR